MFIADSECPERSPRSKQSTITAGTFLTVDTIFILVLGAVAMK